MIDYPIDFLENQTDLSEMGYYIVMTGGGARVKIDGLLGDVDGDGNSLNHISWNSVGSSFGHSCGGSSVPLGEVPLQNGSIDLILLDDTYLTYGYSQAVINLYATHSSFTSDKFICAYRVTDVKKDGKKISLTLDNKYLSSARVKNMIDSKVPDTTFSSAKSLIQTYQYINSEISPSFESSQETSCVNEDFSVYRIFDETYREALSDIGGIASGGIILKTGDGTNYSNFRFAPLNFKPDYDALTDTYATGDGENKHISSSGAITDKTDYCVTDLIEIDFGKSYIFDLGDVSSLTNIRFNIYDSDGSTLLLYGANVYKYITKGKRGYFVPGILCSKSSVTGYIRICTQSQCREQLYIKAVDHILKNWISIKVDLPVSVTGFKYAYPVDGKKTTIYSNVISMTAIEQGSNQNAHGQDHLSLILDNTAFVAHANKQYDMYAVFDVSTGKVISVGYDASGVEWNNDYYIILAHGIYSQWVISSVSVGDTLKVNSNSLELKVVKNGQSQDYILDLSENKLLTDRALSAISPIIVSLSDRLIGHAFYPFEGEHINLPFIEPFDSVGIVDETGDVFFSFVTDFTFAPYGKTSVSNNVSYGTVI